MEKYHAIHFWFFSPEFLREFFFGPKNVSALGNSKIQPFLFFYR